MTSTKPGPRAIGLAMLGVAAGIAAIAPGARAQGQLPQCSGAPATWNGCTGTRRDRDGEYTGEWRNGRRHGRGTYVYANGDRYEGDYTDDRQTGSGTYVTRDGERQSGRFTDGRRDGYFTVTGTDGKRSTVNYRDGAPANLSGAGGAGPRDGASAGAEGRASSSYGQGAAAAGVAGARAGGGQVAVGAMAAQGGQYMQSGRNENHDGYTGQPSGPVGRAGGRANVYAPQGTQLSPGAEPARTQVASAGAAPARPAVAQGTTATPVARTTGAQPAALVAAAPTRVAASPAVFGVPTKERKVALVIGNSAYAHANPLPNPKNDANDMAKMLKGLGFTVVSGTDLGHDAMAKTIRAFMTEAQTADVALFFYAGHGIQVSGQNYLIPVDAKVEDSSALDFELVNIDAVTGHMGGENKVGIILLDACRNNPFANSLTRNSGTRAVQVSKGLAQISSQGGGLLVAFATAPGDVAADGKAGRNSPFTTALLEQMPTPGLEIELMMKRVKAEVIADTANSQRPWHNSDLAREVYLTQPKG